MNTSSDAAEQIVRMSLEGFQVVAKITGSGAKDIGALLYAILKDKRKTSGKTSLANMLKSGKELKVFSFRQEDLKKFTEEAKRYGVLYTSLINRKTKEKDGIVDIMTRAEDAAKISRIIKRFNLSSYEEANIRSEVEKSINEYETKDKGVKTKTVEDKIKDEEKTLPIKKEVESLSPHLAKTEKNPRLKPSSKMQKISDQGTRVAKPSVKVKLERAKEEVKKQSEIKSEQIKTLHSTKKKKTKEKPRL